MPAPASTAVAHALLLRPLDELGRWPGAENDRREHHEVYPRVIRAILLAAYTFVDVSVKLSAGRWGWVEGGIEQGKGGEV